MHCGNGRKQVNTGPITELDMLTCFAGAGGCMCEEEGSRRRMWEISMVEHSCDPRTQEAEAGRARVQD